MFLFIFTPTHYDVSASEMCVHTNDNFLVESLALVEEKSKDGAD
jgi:hypothetical protein